MQNGLTFNQPEHSRSLKVFEKVDSKDNTATNAPFFTDKINNREPKSNDVLMFVKKKMKNNAFRHHNAQLNLLFC